VVSCSKSSGVISFRAGTQRKRVQKKVTVRICGRAEFLKALEEQSLINYSKI